MMNNISPTNLIFILAYAFDLNWLYLEDEASNADLRESSLFELLVFVLTRWTSELLKYGLFRDFLNVTEDTRRLKKKICFKPLIRKQSLQNGRIVCEYDDLSFDILENRILLSTLRYCNYELYCRSRMPMDYKKRKELERLSLEVSNQVKLLSSQVGSQEIEDKLFNQLVFHKMNMKYKPILYLCKMIYESGLLYHRGIEKFIDIPERKLNQIFERFLRNFLAEKLGSLSYQVEERQFQSNTWLQGRDEASVKYMPAIHPDIVVWEKGVPKFVIDAKFYEKPLYKVNYPQEIDEGNGEEKEDSFKTHSHNLYQIMAYTQYLNCNGILVYAQTEQGQFEEMVYLNDSYYDENEKDKSKKRQFGFCTLDLTGNFEEFKNRMDEFILKIKYLLS
jgi:5-methylcytosine-specific restriction enzyme subunit McrC